MIAIVIACLALVVSVISVAATGAMALQLRLVRPRTSMSAPSEPEPAELATLGRRVEDLLGPLIEVTVPLDNGPAVMRDSFLLGDGTVLVTSTSCGSCRYLISEAKDLLAERGVRVLVAAPTLDRGIEFVSRDCGADAVMHQVDPNAERAGALGIQEFPSVLTISGGVLTAAHLVITKAQLDKVSHRHTPSAKAGTSAGEQGR